jgi:hypothetical protein
MSALTTQVISPVVKMGAELARVSRAPDLPTTADNFPRTMFLTRLLSGSSEADTFLAHLLALPTGSATAVVQCGGPAGPSFKSHDQSLSLRLQSEDQDLTAKVIDFRVVHNRRHMIILFDPECLRSAIQLLDDFAMLQIPVDILFITCRSEKDPSFVSQLEERNSRVVRAFEKSLRMDYPAGTLLYPPISPQLETAYANGALNLREIVDGSSLGIQLAFERNLMAFATSLQECLHG